MGYIVNDPMQTMTSLTFTENRGVCGSFTYTIQMQGGGAINTSIFTFNSAVPSIDVVSHSNADINTYNLELTGTLGPWGS